MFFLEEHREFKVICKRVTLRVLENFQLSEKMWIPVPTPNSEVNIDSGKAISFLEGKDLQSAGISF